MGLLDAASGPAFGQRDGPPAHRAPLAPFGLRLLLLLAVAPAGAVLAQLATPTPPAQMSYQGFLTDANGNALAATSPTNYNIYFRIYNASTGLTNTALWGELQTVTVDKGYFSVILGQGSPISGTTLSSVNGGLAAVFTNTDASLRYIGLTVQGLNPGGGDTEIQPRLRLLPSGYAFLAGSANSLLSSTTGAQIVNTSGTSVGINQVPSGADALDVTGNVTITGTLSADLNASQLTTGTLPASVFGAIPAGSLPAIPSTDLPTNLQALANNDTLTLGGATLSEGVLSIGGVTHFNDNPIYLRGGTNDSHWLGYVDTFSIFVSPGFPAPIYETYTIDGPMLMGYSGGALAAAHGGGFLGDEPVIALRWDTGGNIYTAGAVNPTCDRNLKQQFEEVNPKQILDKVLAMPITKWSYKSDPKTRHIGPVAQDFHAAFEVGVDDKHIATVDDSGVALAAIKGLNQVVQEKDAELEALKRQVQELQTTVQNLVKEHNSKAQ